MTGRSSPALASGSGATRRDRSATASGATRMCGRCLDRRVTGISPRPGMRRRMRVSRGALSRSPERDAAPRGDDCPPRRHTASSASRSKRSGCSRRRGMSSVVVLTVRVDGRRCAVTGRAARFKAWRGDGISSPGRRECAPLHLTTTCSPAVAEALRPCGLDPCASGQRAARQASLSLLRYHMKSKSFVEAVAARRGRSSGDELRTVRKAVRLNKTDKRCQGSARPSAGGPMIDHRLCTTFRGQRTIRQYGAGSGDPNPRDRSSSSRPIRSAGQAALPSSTESARDTAATP